MNPKVAIVILNWNGWKDTIKCLESLYQITYPNYDIILVDNGSYDNSIQKINEYCQGKLPVISTFFEYSPENKPIKIIEYTRKTAGAGESKEKKIADLSSNKKLILIKNERNYGYAEETNIGIRHALKMLTPEYVLLLNNDTFVDKEFLAELVKVIETDEWIGSAQSLLLKPGGRIIDSLGQELLIWGARDRGLNSKYRRNLKENREIFGSCAAAALYRCKVLRKIGLFDKDFFAIFEDVDLSWRIRLDGLTSILVYKSVVYHKRGASTPPLIKRYHYNKNWLLIALRYYPLSVIYAVLLRYPYQFFATFLMCVYYALKLGKIRHLLKIIAKSLKIRKSIKKKLLLCKIQRTWIKRLK